jgi:putative CocE/NonD family hydrolase
MSGVSYLATIQWWAASLQSKHLAAINPCEGLTDPYREFIFHGGIQDTSFPALWQHNRLKFSTSKVEALFDMGTAHPFDDEYWASKRPDFSKIEVPAYVIASWSDQGLHTRGTLEAFENIASKHKYLEVHGRKKWAYFHQPSTVERQRAFFDRYLMGKDDAIDSWPLVRYELRTGYYEGIDCTSKTWPLPGRTLKTLHLDAVDGTLKDDASGTPGSVRYEAGTEGGEAVFEHVFDTQTEIVGGAGLKLWITAEDAEDADIFVGLRKLNKDGNPVNFPFSTVLEKGPVALGWLRASHRELDPAKSTPDRPWHPHAAEKPLLPGEPTVVDIEIWPSATRFEASERLQLVVRGSDLHTKMTPSRHLQTRNSGAHVISTGDDHDSQLVINVIKRAHEA